MATSLPPAISGPIIANLTEDTLTAWIPALHNVYDPDTFNIFALNIPALPPGVTYNDEFDAFIVDSNHPAWQVLGAGQVAQVRIDFAVSDGESVVPHSLIINMTGTNDPAFVTGIATGAVIEDTVTVAEGQLFVSDIDQGEAGFRLTQTPIQGSFGSLTITADGHWTYVLDNASAAVQALTEGEVMAEVFTVQTVDGTPQQISVTIEGRAETVLTGTAGDDVLTGMALSETIYGLGGRDSLSGGAGNDTIDGGSGTDSLYGGDGDDVIVFDSVDRVQSGGAGVDVLSVTRSITVNLGAADQVSGDTGTTTGFEQVDATFATASVNLTGSAGDNILAGGVAGDRLAGGLGVDILQGNGGADRFIFRSAAEAAGDEIADFTHGVDRIDLSGIDAITGGRDNAFSFIGGAAFSRAGQLRYDAASGQVLGDLNGDRIADLALDIGAGLVITASDFVL